MLLQYTERHPDVIALTETLDDMRATRERELSASAAPVGVPGVDRNPVYQSMKISLSQAEVDLREVQARVGQQAQRVDELRRMVDTIPEIEAELQRLNRDYDVNQTQYQELLQRRELARMSDQANEMGDEIQFRVIEPPVLPLEPYGPNRLLFLTAVFVLSLGIGGAVTFVMYQLKPVFFTAESLRQSFGRPVLGAVSRVWTGNQKRSVRLKSASFIVGISALFVAFGAAVVFEQRGVQLVGQLMRMVVS